MVLVKRSSYDCVDLRRVRVRTMQRFDLRAIDAKIMSDTIHSPFGGVSPFVAQTFAVSIRPLTDYRRTNFCGWVVTVSGRKSQLIVDFTRVTESCKLISGMRYTAGWGKFILATF